MALAQGPLNSVHEPQNAPHVQATSRNYNRTTIHLERVGEVREGRSEKKGGDRRAERPEKGRGEARRAGEEGEERKGKGEDQRGERKGERKDKRERERERKEKGSERRKRKGQERRGWIRKEEKRR